MREAELPAILGPADIARYRAIRTLQDEGRWAAADAEIAALEDPLLLGHVLAQRYLHRSYKVSYGALQAWLARYADLPEAHAIHALAQNRRPAGTHAPTPPEGSPIALRGIVDDPADLRPAMRTSPSERVTQAKSDIRRLSRTDPLAAEQALEQSDGEHLFEDTDYDDARADVIEGYLFAGETQKALVLAQTTRTPAFLPLAHWDAGIAAWRLGKLGEARLQFETLARMPSLSRWNQSAAAFWAARVEARSHHSDLANYWLGIAADQPRTFYGLLARRMLALDTYFNFEPEIFTNVNLNALTGIPAARRALALIQLGATPAAELELRTLASTAPSSLYPALAALADSGNMPALSVQLATMLSAVDGRRHDHALFPLPRWQPMGGFTVDRALLFALMRQESQFLPDAESSVGAVGLMQLMPDTASELAARLGIKLPASRKAGRGLTDPEVNLTLGQKYLRKLLDHDQIRGNLIFFTAAYNSGPSNLLRWRDRAEFRNDPLLFLESLPLRETRIFTQRVLTNYWVYRLQLGQPTRDLDMLARGDWPVYVAVDASTQQVASNASPR